LNPINNHLYVADNFNNRIEILNSLNGDYIGEIGSKQKISFESVFDLMLDCGLLFISDTICIYVVDVISSDLLHTISKIFGPNQFSHIRRMAISPIFDMPFSLFATDVDRICLISLK